MSLYNTLPILILISSLCHLPSIEASITLIGSGNKVYRTIQEKNYGNLLNLRVEYVARLQYLGDNGDRGDGQNDINDLLCNIDDIDALNKKLKIPHDKLPVALLVSNEKCPAKTKAAVVSFLSPQNIVRHLIVYGSGDTNHSRSHMDTDDDGYNDGDDYFHSKKFHQAGNDWNKSEHHTLFQSTLSSSPNNIKRQTTSSYWDLLYEYYNHGKNVMVADDPRISVSVLYVSHEDGLDIIQRLSHQSQRAIEEGGFQILVDGYDGTSPYYNDEVTAGDIISITALILLCCLTFSCIFTTNAVSGAAVHIGNEDEDLLPGDMG